MAYKKYVSIIFSACMLAIALWQPSYFWWAVFVYAPFFLLAGILHEWSITIVDGMLWGFTFFLAHAAPIFYSCVIRASNCFLGIFVVSLIVLWVACISALCFYLVCELQHHTGTHSLYRLFLWAGGLWLFALCVDYLFLLPCGCAYGYPLSFPLLPLAVHGDMFLFLLPYAGQNVLLACLLVSAALLVWGTVQRRMLDILLSLVFLTPFFAGIVWRQDVSETFLVRFCCWVQPPSPTCTNQFDRAQEISFSLIECVQKHPHSKIIFMAESTYPFPINNENGVAESWARIIAHRSRMLIMGTHVSVGTHLFNAIAFIPSSGPWAYHGKKICMPLVEYLPSFLHCAWVEKIFLKGYTPFACDGNRRACYAVSPSLVVEPYVCAEFFMSHYPSQEHVPVLCLAHDGWFSGPCVARLMLCHAQYKACFWQRMIIYVTHNCAFFIYSNSKKTPMLGIK